MGRLSLMETISMEGQNATICMEGHFFSGKRTDRMLHLSSAEFA